MKKDIKFLKPIQGGVHGCFNCGFTHEVLPLDTEISVGFGSAEIYRDEDLIYEADLNADFEFAPRLAKFEALARLKPNHDWRYKLNLPLRSAEYQRQGKDHWVLVKKGMGFA